MVMARLHIICGNCGCNELFESKLERDFIENENGSFEDETAIHCKNCSTIHFLSDSIKPVDQDTEI